MFGNKNLQESIPVVLTTRFSTDSMATLTIADSRSRDDVYSAIASYLAEFKLIPDCEVFFALLSFRKNLVAEFTERGNFLTFIEIPAIVKSVLVWVKLEFNSLGSTVKRKDKHTVLAIISKETREKDYKGLLDSLDNLFDPQRPECLFRGEALKTKLANFLNTRSSQKL